MFNIKELIKSIITVTTILILTLSAGTSFAQGDPDIVITAIDAATGRVVEATKLLSEMTEEEKAAYSEEDIKILDAHEAELKKQAEMPKY